MQSSDIPFALQPPSRPVSNAEFLEAIARHVPEELDDEPLYLWCTAFPGDPNASGQTWKGEPVWRPVEKYLLFADSLNAYFTVSAFGYGLRGDTNAPRTYRARSKRNFRGQFCVVLDDLGQKIPWSVLEGKPVPTWVLRTSPGSYQVGYVLDAMVEDRLMAEALVDALIYQGLGAERDPGSLGVTRNVRLPQGVNGKAAYYEWWGDGAPRCELVHWAPELVYSVDALVEAFGLDLEKAKVGCGFEGQVLRSGVAPEDDPWVEVWAAAGLTKGNLTNKGGGGIWLDVYCPQAAQHTGGDVSGSAYAIGGGYKCHHGHCDDLAWPAVRDGFLRGDWGEEAQRLARAARSRELFAGDLAEPEIRERILGWGGSPPAGGDNVLGYVAAPPHDQGRAGGQEGSQGGNDTFDAVLWQAYIDGRLPEKQSGLEASVAVQEVLSSLAHLFPGPSPTELEGVLQYLKDKSGLGILSLRDQYKALRKEAEKQTEQERLQRRIGEAQAEALVRGWAPCPVIVDRWRAQVPGSDNEPLLVTDNVEQVLQAAGVTVRWNIMRFQLEYTAAQGSLPRSLTDFTTMVQDWCMKNGMLKAQHLPVGRSISLLSSFDEYHPFQDYLDRIRGRWDGVDRIKALAETLPVAEEDEEIRDLIVRRWLFSVAAAARNLYKGYSGAQPRGLLVLASKQYAGKSTWIQSLFDLDGYKDGDGTVLLGAHYDGSKDSLMRVVSHLVCEFGELDTTTRKADAGTLKTLFSAPWDEFRRPYQSAQEKFDRRTVFAGTVNEPYLVDPTGNSRYWTIPLTGKITSIRKAGIDLMQLWAQVDVQCLEGWERAKADVQGAESWAPWLMTEEELEQIERRNEGHRIETPEAEWVMDTFDWENEDWLAAKAAWEQDPSGWEAKSKWCAAGLGLRGGDLGSLYALNGQRSTRAALAAITATVRRLTGLQSILEWREPADAEGKRKHFKAWPMPPGRAKTPAEQAAFQKLLDQQREREAHVRALVNFSSVQLPENKKLN